MSALSHTGRGGHPVMAISNMAVSSVVIWHNITNHCHLEVEIVLAQ